MENICPKCGLAKEFCVCETLTKEEQKIKIYSERIRFKRFVTMIDGLSSDVDKKGLAKELKTKLACGGTIKDGKIELQGQHKERVKELLVKMGFNADQIEIV
jgi:translation initiation factor 1